MPTTLGERWAGVSQPIPSPTIMQNNVASMRHLERRVELFTGKRLLS
jgi:hypothetical protein